MFQVKKLKKWLNMLTGKSILHIDKGEGLYWSMKELGGYYIDYSGKVNTHQLDKDGVPYSKLSDGRQENIPITVIQYGLGCYEKILSGDKTFVVPLKICADHMLKTQNSDGMWDAFKAQKKTDYYSSMIQSQGVSLLLRAYKLTNNNAYLLSAQKAFDAMLKPVAEGGTAFFKNGHIHLLEAVDRPMILNGAIYSMFGVLDMWVMTRDEKYYSVLQSVLEAIKDELKNFDTGFWSKYCLDGAYTSPFYHKVHITQLRLLAKMFDDEFFLREALKYEKYMQRKLYCFVAFVIKAFQKITEKNSIIAIVE